MSREIRSWLMDMDGVLVHEEHADPRRGPLHRGGCASSGMPFLRAHQQLDLHARATSPPGCAASGLDVPEESIWTSALATARFLDDQRPGGIRVRDRRGRA